MLSTNAPAMSTRDRPHWIWLLTLIVASLPVAFGCYQVWIFFDEAFPHLYRSRTLPAFAGVALALAGIVLPLGLIIKRNAFCRWSRTQQFAAFIAVAVFMAAGYILPFILLCDAARASPAILPYTARVFLIYSSDDDFPIDIGVVGGLGTGHGGGESDQGKVAIMWNAWLEPPDLPRPSGPDPVVQVRCEARTDTSPLTMDVKISAGRPVRFDTRGLADRDVQKAGKQVALPIELDAGTHRFTICASAEAAP